MRIYTSILLVFISATAHGSLHRFSRQATGQIDALLPGSALTVRVANMEIYNKAPASITITIQDSTGAIFERTLGQDGVFQLEVDCSRELKITVKDCVHYYYDFSSWLIRKMAQERRINPADLRFLLTYKENIGLVPATGPFKGLRGVTKTGLSKKNNVSKEELDQARQEFARIRALSRPLSPACPMPVASIAEDR